MYLTKGAHETDGRCPVIINEQSMSMSRLGAPLPQSAMSGLAATRRVNTTMYHINPLSYPAEPINMDLGDLAGDVFFDISQAVNAFSCSVHPTPHGVICDNGETAGQAHDIGVTELVVEHDEAHGSYATCNICVHGSSPLNHSHHCNAGEYVCDCESPGFPPHRVPCTAQVGWQNTSSFLGSGGVGKFCLFAHGNAKIATCATGTAADKLQGIWYSTLLAGRGKTWRVVDVVKRVRRDCHMNSFYGTVEKRAPKCFAACGPPPRNTSSLCWAGCFSDAALGPQARTTIRDTTSGMSREDLMDAWHRPFASDEPAEGGCPNVPCKLWRDFATRHEYCDPPGSGSKYAIDLRAAYGPQCTPGVSGSECCWMPLGYGGGPPFGSPCRDVCERLGRKGDDEAFCEMSSGLRLVVADVEQSSEGEAAPGEPFGNCLCGPSA